MKTIGLIGGMSWESSAVYYRLINEGVRAQLGGTSSADCVMVSPNFQEIEALQHQGAWDILEQRMVELALRLQAADAQFIVLCTNTMHRFAENIRAQISIPFLHIADPTAQKIRAAGMKRVGLLGTRFTMEEDFYKNPLEREYAIDVLVPELEDRKEVHRIIYDELVQGIVNPHSREIYQGVIARLVARGAEAIVLGCTEIMLLLGEGDASVPLFDTTTLHAAAAVELALG